MMNEMYLVTDRADIDCDGATFGNRDDAMAYFEQVPESEREWQVIRYADLSDFDEWMTVEVIASK